MMDMISKIAQPLNDFTTEHNKNIASMMNKGIDPSNLKQVTELRMEWQKVTLGMELQSSLLSRLEKACETMINKF